MSFTIGKYKIKDNPFEIIKIYLCKIGVEGKWCAGKYMDTTSRCCTAGIAISEGEHSCQALYIEKSIRMELWRYKPDLLVELESGVMVKAKEILIEQAGLKGIDLDFSKR